MYTYMLRFMKYKANVESIYCAQKNIANDRNEQRAGHEDQGKWNAKLERGDSGNA